MIKKKTNSSKEHSVTEKSDKKTSEVSKRVKKNKKSITTTSIAFKSEILSALKKHEKHVKEDQSISWIVNRLSEKFIAGEVVLN